MNAVIFAFTENGVATARHVRDAVGGRIVAPARLAGGDVDGYEGALSDCVGGAFDSDALIFVSAAGIAVRAVAPHAVSKRSDPAVLCLDERARFVIPLLSGHIGGANRLARTLAQALGATPVVTTATDVNGRFAVDAWAAERDLAITDMALAKAVSAAILTRDIPFCADAAFGEKLPAGLVRGESGPLGVCVSSRDRHPFDETLLLVPRALTVGVGCKRGTSSEAIGALIDSVLAAHDLRIEAVARVNTIDVKRGEPGLISLCAARRWPMAFYSAGQLAAVPGAFVESDFVRKAVGVGNVCERAALAGGGRLIAPKTAQGGVTVAVAELEWGIDFD